MKTYDALRLDLDTIGKKVLLRCGYFAIVMSRAETKPEAGGESRLVYGLLCHDLPRKEFFVYDSGHMDPVGQLPHGLDVVSLAK